MRLAFALALATTLTWGANTSAQCVLQKLTVEGSYGSIGNPEGRAIAVEGDLMVIGIPTFISYPTGWPGVSAGGAAVFERTGGTWVQTDVLLPSDPVDEKSFGWSVAISGERVVIGAPWELDVIGSKPPGDVYVFERSANGWVETAKLQGAGLGIYAKMGWSVDVDGDVIVAGAPGNQITSSAGSVFVFELQGGLWTETAAQHWPSSSEQLGEAVAVEGDTILAWVESMNARVEVLARSGATWSIVDEIVPDDPEPFDAFGYSLSLDDDRVAIGAPDRDDGKEDSGAAYVFDRTAGVWTQTVKLTASDRSAEDELGHVVSLDADVVLVGAPNGADFYGSAYLYRESGGAWSETQVLAPDGEQYDFFGTEVALEGDDMFVLSPDDGGDPSPGPGSVYAWSVSEAGCPTLLGLDASVSLSAGGEQLLLLDAGAAHAGLVYLLLGTSAGTLPGIPVGSVVLPLNHDGPGGYLLHTLANPNKAPLDNSLGFFDSDGRASARFQIPPGTTPLLSGLELHHAYVVLDPGLAAVFASEAEPVTLVD